MQFAKNHTMEKKKLGELTFNINAYITKIITFKKKTKKKHLYFNYLIYCTFLKHKQYSMELTTTRSKLTCMNC